MKTNYVAVIVSAVVYWVLGAVWYGFLFGKAWMDLEHLSIDQAKSMNPVLPYFITFVLNLVIAFFLAQLCTWRNASTAARGASLGVLLWIGFVGPITYTTNMYEMRPFNLFLINEGYSLVGLLLIGAILGAWTKKPA